jgi:PAS domain S-box-containing protein
MSVSTPEHTVQIVVSSDGDRAGLREFLGDQYTLSFEETVQPADCYLVTSRTLPEHAESLRREKQRQEPKFCPVLLIQQQGDSLDNAFLSSEAGRELVDDIMTAPVEKPILHRRVENLLSRRGQSITLSRRYERAESWFQALFDAIPDPAFVIDTDGFVRETNAAFCEFTDNSRDELLGTKLSEFPVTASAFEEFPIGADPEHVAATDELIRCEDGTEMEYALLSTRATEVRESLYIIGILSDVTELQVKTERLEKLASVLSHDLRNPVQVADLYLTNLQEMHPESEQTVVPIQRAIDRIGELTEELVTVARTGENMALEPLWIESCAHEAWNHVETERAELVVEQADRTVTGDPNRVLQLFENLFRNAVEHGSSDATVWVGCEADSFYVEDDGPGIPADEREAVLELGYSTNPHGNGLGLGIVREIARAHGWEIRIEDSRTGGARFEIYGVESLTDDGQ